MAKSKTPNERIKRAYIDFLRQAMGRSEASLEAVAAALHRFESYTRFRDFHDFHIEQAKGASARFAPRKAREPVTPIAPKCFHEKRFCPILAHAGLTCAD